MPLPATFFDASRVRSLFGRLQLPGQGLSPDLPLDKRYACSPRARAEGRARGGVAVHCRVVWPGVDERQPSPMREESIDMAAVVDALPAK